MKKDNGEGGFDSGLLSILFNINKIEAKCLKVKEFVLLYVFICLCIFLCFLG